MKIFYSWQADLPNSTNRGFIERALEKASAELAKTNPTTVTPVIERDIAGLPGAADILNGILDKIDAADVLVADVTIVTSPRAKRPAPNPNVLFELGYAWRSLSHQRIVLVLNTHYGKPERLPFDIRAHAVLSYTVAPNDTSKSPVRDELSRKLLAALQEILESAPQRPLIVGRVRQVDLELFKRFLAELPSRGSIDFIDHNNMAGFAFEDREMAELERFARDWGDPEHQFHDEVLEVLRGELYASVTEYLHFLALNTWYLKGSGTRFRSVPPEWEEEQPERFSKVVGKLHSTE